MNRLTEAAYNGSWERYTYDLAGNRLKKETGKGQKVYVYNVRNQLVRMEKGAEITDYHYDAQGNLLEEFGNRKKKYAYDALNRLSIVTMDSIAQKNHYDGESLRYEVEENDKVIRFVFDRGELSAEENAGQKIRYIHGNDNKAKAIAMGLIPDVKMKPGTKYPDFGAAGQIIDIEHLPEHLWLAKDRVQFQYLDDLIGGRPEGTTWNHSEIPGQMELVPFGIHNIINHLGGAIPGHWAYRPGGR